MSTKDNNKDWQVSHTQDGVLIKQGDDEVLIPEEEAHIAADAILEVNYVAE